jgi:osmotically-inducible protein OsmY
VSAEATHGVVTLRGVIDQANQKLRAEATVSRVPCVIGVRSEIAVRVAVEFSQPTLHP